RRVPFGEVGMGFGRPESPMTRSTQPLTGGVCATEQELPYQHIRSDYVSDYFLLLRVAQILQRATPSARSHGAQPDANTRPPCTMATRASCSQSAAGSATGSAESTSASP